MARKVRQDEHDARINEILDAAQALIYTKGYAQMTVRDVIDAVGCSKGAFYHYFDSKQALIEALVDRITDQVRLAVQPVLDDPSLSALAKLETVFKVGASWKSERIDMLASLLDVWYGDENALVREKLTRASLARIHPVYQTLVEAGIAEGSMDTPHPDLAGDIAMDLMISMSSHMVEVLLNWNQAKEGRKQIANLIGAYTDAIERVLGVERGSLTLMDPAMFDAWGEAMSAQVRKRGTV